MNLIIELILLCVLVIAPFVLTTFDDSIAYRINWPGGIVSLTENADVVYKDEDAILINTANNEKYKCMIPSAFAESDAANVKKDFKSPIELLSPLLKSKSCVHYVVSYWSYQVCHGKHIRQYHEERTRGGVKLQEYFLGYFNVEIDESGIFSALGNLPETPEDIPVKKVDGVMTPFYSVDMKNGTPCGLMGGEKRKTKVLYVCHPESYNHIMSISETSSCEYEVIILTPLLCQNPFYKVKTKPVNEIYCKALDRSPVKPQSLQQEIFEEGQDSNIFKPPILETEDEEKQSDSEPTKNEYRRVDDIGISAQTDKALLKQFLNGDFCLPGGGSDYWKYEFCYGKHVKQFHDDKTLGRQTIMVGRWDKEKHLNWVKNNSPRIYKSKKSHDDNKVLYVRHFYSNGDLCHEVHKPREVIVKLHCMKSSTSHAVTIYLREPSTCSYILGVESPIICDLLDTADEYGLFADQ